jgi:hypothetical protein
MSFISIFLCGKKPDDEPAWSAGVYQEMQPLKGQKDAALGNVNLAIHPEHRTRPVWWHSRLCFLMLATDRWCLEKASQKIELTEHDENHILLLFPYLLT